MDDDERFRGELRQLLAREPEVSVAEARDGDEALRLTREMRPSVVLMDITMPSVDGLEATRRIKALQPETKVIIVTVHAEEPYRRAARESGADGFLVKKTLMGELMPMIRRLVPHPREGTGDSPVS
ncbi:MAG: response regulator transcription factor [Candidatus Rokubacteria bacterium]|nr:response regulator transcription factor [Candidatus Rokubacteria bacterium]